MTSSIGIETRPGTPAESNIQPFLEGKFEMNKNFFTMA